MLTCEELKAMRDAALRYPKGRGSFYMDYGEVDTAEGVVKIFHRDGGVQWCTEHG